MSGSIDFQLAYSLAIQVASWPVEGMSGSSGWAQAMRFFCPMSSYTPGTGLRIMYRPLATAAWVHSWMVAAADSYWTMVLMPRAFHLGMEPLGWDQAPMTKKSGPDVLLGR